MNQTAQLHGAGRNVTVLLGAGRGGTTLLYKLLALHRDVGYISNYAQRFPGLLPLSVLDRLPSAFPQLKRNSWFQPEGGAYFNSRRAKLQAMLPTPIEGEAVYERCGIPLTPQPGQQPDALACRRLAQAFETLRRWAGARVLVTKRTANNRRIPWLQQAFPQARYIHLVRDGRSVAHSLLRVKWWDDHVVFWAGKTPRQLVQEGSDALDIAARNWVEEMVAIEEGLKLLDPAQVLQMRYEDLLAHPERELDRAFAFIGVPADADPAFRSLLGSLNLAPAKEAWPQRWSPQQLAAVHALQAPTLQHWGYPV